MEFKAILAVMERVICFQAVDQLGAAEVELVAKAVQGQQPGHLAVEWPLVLMALVEPVEPAEMVVGAAVDNVQVRTQVQAQMVPLEIMGLAVGRHPQGTEGHHLGALVLETPVLVRDVAMEIMECPAPMAATAELVQLAQHRVPMLMLVAI